MSQSLSSRIKTLEEALLTLGNQLDIMASYIETLESYNRELEKSHVTYNDEVSEKRLQNLRLELNLYKNIYKG